MINFLFYIILLSSSLFSQSLVKTGIDVLIEKKFSLLEGKRIGLVTNPTGITKDFRTTLDVLSKAKNIKLVAVFAPEHGVRGDIPAGEIVNSYIDSLTQLPVYSLYGKQKKPTSTMLKNIDALVYDIQDIGCRSYTYISTMANIMEAAAENNLECIILDRPNPLTGNLVEGNILEMQWKSFVGQFPIPYIYGMTCGELALMINEKGWLANGKKCSLKIMLMEGWKRSMWWEDTGLPWIPTSPHIPTSITALYYPTTGILGELQFVNIGVGYTLPFQLVGATWLNTQQFADELNSKKLDGVYFRPISYTPFYGSFKNQQLHGVQIHITNREKFSPIKTQLHIVQSLQKYFPEKNFWATIDSQQIKMFDKVWGTSSVREQLLQNISVDSIINSWQKRIINEFLVVRKKYLFYN